MIPGGALLELSDLRLFQAVAEEGSISGAAKRLDYVQSNITARLQRLEDELGVLLFYRKPRGVQITEKGELFRPYVDAILQMADESIKILHDQGKISGSLKIGVIETITCGNFMNIIAAYQSQYEQVTLSLETGNPLQLLEKVKNFELDAAFVTGQINSDNFDVDYLFTDEIVLLSGKAIDNLDFTTQRWAVSPSGCPFRKVLEQWLKDEGNSLSNFIEISSLETLLSSVKAGLTFTLLPKSVLKGSYEDLHVYPIPEQYRFIETVIIKRKEKYLSHAYKAFADLVKHEGL